MSLWQAGFKNVVGVTVGAGAFPNEWLNKLEGIGRICLCYDHDEAGQRGVYSTAQKLGFARCQNVLLPQGQDVNDFFKDNPPDNFKKLQEEAKKFSIPSIISVHDLIGYLIESPVSDAQKEGIKTEWENVNRLIPSYQPGELIALSAVPKTGKTTFALNIAYFNAMHGIPCLFYCIEMGPDRLLPKILSIKLGKPINQLDNNMMKEARTNIARSTPVFMPGL